jgi:hypothetical protein
MQSAKQRVQGIGDPHPKARRTCLSVHLAYARPGDCTFVPPNQAHFSPGSPFSTLVCFLYFITTIVKPSSSSLYPFFPRPLKPKSKSLLSWFSALVVRIASLLSPSHSLQILNDYNYDTCAGFIRNNRRYAIKHAIHCCQWSPPATLKTTLYQCPEQESQWANPLQVAPLSSLLCSRNRIEFRDARRLHNTPVFPKRSRLLIVHPNITTHTTTLITTLI